MRIVPCSALLPIVSRWRPLDGLGSGIRDFRIHEPSLEDVFFGFAD